jgi:outer membrane receptor for ferrienterochelin and colicins
MHKQAHVFLSIVSLIGFSSLAQETFTDSIKPTINTQLEEVVVTGQIEPQSLKKSVFNVRIISQQDIQRLAANNLSDVLNQYLNITVSPSGRDGRSTVSMFGLDGQYFKILIDNVPVVSETGLGNNVDLTQINLADVEQIEIIEGSMGVTHGANAVSGVLNIITKKSAKNRWEIGATVQEESVGDEYTPFGDEGRHIQSLKVYNNINTHWFVSVGANRNDFTGYKDNMMGKDYYINDGLRGYSWLPKEQWVTNALINYQKGTFRIFYKFDYFNENVDYYNPVVAPISNYPFPDTYYSKDERYGTNRFYHHLNSSGHLYKLLTYNVSASYQKQEREVDYFNYHILSDEEKDHDKFIYQSNEVIYSTGNFANFFKNKKFDLQLGYELVNEKGFASGRAGTFRDENNQREDITARLENYDIYATAEINCTSRFSIRPGYRYSFQSKFEDQQALSLGFRYLFNKDIEVRASIGRSYRTPNFDELYTYMVDSNHNIQGNDGLVPELSTSYEASIKKTTFFNSGLRLSNNLIVTHLDVDDRISLILASTDPIWAYKYMNIDQYKSWNFSTTHQLAYKNLDAKLGISLVGVSQTIDMGAEEAVSSDDYLYSLQLNTSIGYNIPKWNTLFSVYYKYNGKFQQYVQGVNTSGDATFILSEISPYSMMDASVKKTFFKNSFDVTLGARNLLNVKSVQTTQAAGNGNHGAPSSDMLLAYGTSFFLKLSYNLNFN